MSVKVKKPRFKIVPPVKGGDEWYHIVDTRSRIMQNFAPVDVSRTLKRAKALAEAICNTLNGE